MQAHQESNPGSEAQPTTPGEIRGLLCTDPALVTDPQLFSLMMGAGTSRRAMAPGLKRKTWTAVAQAEELFAAMDGRLATLVREVCAETLDFDRFGFGKSLRPRLLASMELMARWRRGFHAGGASEIRRHQRRSLSDLVLQHKAKATEAELIAVMIGSTFPDIDNTLLLMDFFGSPEQLIEEFSLSTFNGFRGHCRQLPTPNARGIMGIRGCYKLVAAIELAQRYRTRALYSPTNPLESVGLRSAELVKLFDPQNPIDDEQRHSLINVLRSHPDLREDFARLDRLASDAQTDDTRRAIELHHMFEELHQDGSWTDPRRVLGEPVPYRGLLAIANARLARARRPAARLQKLKELLEQAEEAAMEQPIATFTAALEDLRISPQGIDKALREAARRCARDGASSLKSSA
ncbi:MAG: hypothetical protein AAF560_19970 [Acidobacteriota bacterium]